MPAHRLFEACCLQARSLHSEKLVVQGELRLRAEKNTIELGMSHISDT